MRLAACWRREKEKWGRQDQSLTEILTQAIAMMIDEGGCIGYADGEGGFVWCCKTTLDV
jgi:hypothetical protein